MPERSPLWARRLDTPSDQFLQKKKFTMETSRNSSLTSDKLLDLASDIALNLDGATGGNYTFDAFYV